MALVKCRECGKQISNEAPTCPQCGAPGFGAAAVRGPAPAKKPPTSIPTIPALLLLGGGVWFVFKLIGGDPPAPPLNPPAGAVTSTSTPESRAAALAQVTADFAKSGGAWTVGRNPDRISGKETVILAMPAASFGQNKFGQAVKGELRIQCQGNKTDLYVAVDEFVSTQPVPVTHRIDAAKPVTREWDVSTDYQAVFARGAIPLIKSLTNAENFVVRFTPHGESPMDFPFVVTGLSVHLPAVRKACNW